MSKIKIASREDLVTFFSRGSLPTAEHFETLIYSNFNKADDRLDISPERGLQLYPVKTGQLLNFFEKPDDEKPRYELLISHDGLYIQEVGEDPQKDTETEQSPLLFLQKESGNIGMGNKEPKTKLDVSGIIASKGRIGNYKTGSLPADGKWHNVFEENLQGVHAFEVMAHAKGRRREGKYALLHAIATSTYGRGRLGITSTRTQFRSGDKIQIRWVSKQIQIDKGTGKGEEKGLLGSIIEFFKTLRAPRLRVYNLQLRTKSHFGLKNLDNPNTRLFYRISLLWSPETLEPDTPVPDSTTPKWGQDSLNEFMERLKQETGIDLKDLGNVPPKNSMEK